MDPEQIVEEVLTTIAELANGGLEALKGKKKGGAPSGAPEGAPPEGEGGSGAPPAPPGEEMPPEGA